MSSVRVHRSRVGPSCRVKCSRRTCIRPICFLPTLSHLTTSAASFPTPFNNTLGSSSRAPGAVVLSPVIQFHDSFWRHELTKLDDDRHPAHVKGQLLVGAGAQMQAVETFQQAYAPHGMVPLGSKLVAVDEHERTAFVMFATQVINTGSYGGSPATQLSSTVHGVYRLQFDDEGVVTHAWCHRSPTSEEYAILMAKSSERQIQVDVDLPACTWPTDDRYTRSIHAAAADWMEDVCSKASLQAIFKLASPELRYNDGTCMHLGAPLHGITSFLEHVAKESTERQLGTRVALATAADANKVFMHWKQASICRRSHDMSDIEGVTVLAFNQDAKVTQVIEYRTPSQQDVSQLFKGAASGSAVPPAAPSAVAGTSSAAESMWDAETADALARQSQEWESW